MFEVPAVQVVLAYDVHLSVCAGLDLARRHLRGDCMFNGDNDAERIRRLKADSSAALLMASAIRFGLLITPVHSVDAAVVVVSRMRGGTWIFLPWCMKGEF